MRQRGNTLIGILIGLLIAGGLLGAYYLGSTKNSQPQQNSNLADQPQTTPQSAKSSLASKIFGKDETADWKTYTSQKFGVSFKYPGDLFVYQGEAQKDAQYWSNKANGGSAMELGKDGVWLNLSVTKLDDAGYGYWQTKATSGSWTISHDLPKPNSGGTSYAYSAIQLREKTLYKLSVSAFTDENLANYKNTFDRIISSFKFTN